MLRTVFAALLLIPLACLPADAAQKHKLALQISDNDAAKMNAVLNVAANVSKYYSDKGEEVDIQIIAFNAGLHMLRDDTSPVKPRLKSFKQGMPNVAFMACEDTQRGQGAAARRKCRARQGGRRHPDRARRKGLDDHPPLSATKFLARSGGRPEAAHEEATRPAPEPAEPHGPRRCGGPEHSAGCPNLLAIRRETHV